MTMVDEKEILELEKFKAEIRNFNNSIEDRNRKYFLDIFKVVFYSMAATAGAIFAIAKIITIS
jgi:hypothetical protein